MVQMMRPHQKEQRSDTHHQKKKVPLVHSMRGARDKSRATNEFI
jgi:hypothetical protein